MKTTYQLGGLLLIFSFVSCQPSEPDPDPATLLSGDYVAVTYLTTNSAYPINGKAFTLHIQRVARDTVQVAVQSEISDIYSPRQNLLYAKACIGPGVGSVYNQLERNPYQYTIYLTPGLVNNPKSLNNVLLFYDRNGNQYVDYHYRAPGTNPEWVGEDITRLKRF